MPKEDLLRWNERYANSLGEGHEAPRAFLLQNLDLLPPRGVALDLAMGTGNNAGLLLEKGFNVIGIDISDVAVRLAKRRFPQLMAIIADLTAFHLPSGKFDVVLNFYYLQRELWPEFARILKPGGLLILETLTQEMQSIKPELPEEYLLNPGELKSWFGKWEILVYREGWVETDRGTQKAAASLIARRPADL